MAITLLGHQPIDFLYKENDPCEHISSFCLQYETGDNPMFQLKNTGTSAPLVTIQGIGETDFDEIEIPILDINSSWYTYEVNFDDLGITSGCFEICVYEIDGNGVNMVTNPNFTSDLSGWTTADALIITIDNYTNPTGPMATDGEVEVAATGGTGPYTYSKDGTTYQGSTTFTGLSFAVDYTFYVKDANGVIDTVEFSFRDCTDYAGAFANDVADIYTFEIKECEANNFV